MKEYKTIVERTKYGLEAKIPNPKGEYRALHHKEHPHEVVALMFIPSDVYGSGFVNFYEKKGDQWKATTKTPRITVEKGSLEEKAMDAIWKVLNLSNHSSSNNHTTICHDKNKK